jgi:nitrogen-specific signal transduction histidine kinase
MRAGNRTHEIIRQVLLLNRVRPSARIGLRPHLLVEETVERLRAVLPDSIIVEQKLDRQCPTISGDAAQLQQALLQLANQGASALLAEGGTLTLKVEQTQISLEQAANLGLSISGSFVSVCISTRGNQLNEISWLNVFTNPSLDPGMMLSTTRKIIAEHQGSMDLSFSEKEGGLCTLWLPLSRTLQHHPPASARMCPAGYPGLSIDSDDL